MGTKKLFVSAILFSVLMGGNVMAQNKAQEKGKQKATSEEKMDMAVRRMQQSLVMDEKTAAQFAPIYKEYLQAMKDCAPQKSEGKKGEALTDMEIKQKIEDQFALQHKRLATRELYYQKFEKILNGRQLQRMFLSQPQANHNKKANQDKKSANKKQQAKKKANKR